MTKNFASTSTTNEVLAGVDLAGKRVLVTGTSAGLGVETARALVAHGADVIGTARDLAKGERAPATVRSEEHTSELHSRQYLVFRLLLEKNVSLVRLSLSS